MNRLQSLLSLFDWRTLAVLARNAQVWLRNWRTAMIPPALEPVMYFFAFGLGLGGYVQGLEHAGERIDYASYVAPGMLAFSAFATPYYESLYSAYVRMFYQKTWDGILATQVELTHLLWGEIVWAAVRGISNTTIVCSVLTVFTLAGAVDLHLAYMPMLVLLGGVMGAAFAAFGLLFTVVVPTIDHMNYAVFLVGVPLSFASNTYFPAETSLPMLASAMQANPLYHFAEGCRFALVHGRLTTHLLYAIGESLVLLVMAYVVVLPIARRRLLEGETGARA